MEMTCWVSCSLQRQRKLLSKVERSILACNHIDNCKTFFLVGHDTTKKKIHMDHDVVGIPYNLVRMCS
jgi:hypothetical protein